MAVLHPKPSRDLVIDDPVTPGHLINVIVKGRRAVRGVDKERLRERRASKRR